MEYPPPPPVSMLLNMSLESGIVPKSIKVAKLLLINKSNTINQFCKYRTISLLPILSKVLENVVHKRLYSFLETHNVLYKGRCGFRNRHSTAQAVTNFDIDNMKARENNQHPSATI